MGLGGIAPHIARNRPGTQAGRDVLAADRRRREEANHKLQQRKQEEARRRQQWELEWERDRPAREQAARERAEHERIYQQIYEQIERAQAKRDKIAREEQWERDRPAREQAERERAERERVAREQAKREQAARERIERMVTSVKNGDLDTLKTYIYYELLSYREPASGKSLLSLAVTAKQENVIHHLLHETMSAERCEVPMAAKIEFLNAVKNNDLEGVIKHLSKNRLRDLTIATQTAPLYVAASKGHLEIVRLLLAADAPIDQINNTHFWSKRDTASHIAADHSHEEILTLLVKKGANIDLPSRFGTTAKQIAYEKLNLITTPTKLSSPR